MNRVSTSQIDAMNRVSTSQIDTMNRVSTPQTDAMNRVSTSQIDAMNRVSTPQTDAMNRVSTPQRLRIYLTNSLEEHHRRKKLKKLIPNNFSNDIIFTVHTDECHHTFCQNCKMNECKDRKTDFSVYKKWNIENLIKESDLEIQNSIN